MLKIILDSDKHLHVEMGGRVNELAVEVALSVASMFVQLRTVDPDEADLFRARLLAVLSPDSPVWDLPPADSGVGFVMPDVGGRGH